MDMSASGRPAMHLRVNGVEREVDCAPGTSLLDVLRTSLGLTGAKKACGRGECGACTVLVGGKPALACITLAVRVRGDVVTIEGLADQEADLREAFAEAGGFQCGFCTSGQIVQAAALLRAGLPAAPPAARQAIRQAMSGNICRCTGYNGIVNAVLATAVKRGIVRHDTEEVAGSDGGAR
jgi:aerobic-type carbon monoxide dehydrogenase small subunit (CoxS/CutS family)